MMTSMMKKTMAAKGVASLDELRELSQEAEVKHFGDRLYARYLSEYLEAV